MRGFTNTGKSVFDRCDDIAPSQVLAAFDIEINDMERCLCPFHDDNNPSMLVNNDYVFCFACNKAWFTFQLIRDLLELHEIEMQVGKWLDTTELPDIKRGASGHSEYRGPVDYRLIEYWESCMTPDHYARLYKERLLEEDTARQFHIGWRPDYQAWVLPFEHEGKFVSVQFRLTRKQDLKYIGMKGHNRPAIINADILSVYHPYVVVLFGTFDPMLAWQDGIPAVGTMGSSAFARPEEIKALFAKQRHIYVVPDNTPSEFDGAERFAEMVGGVVKKFPDTLPKDTDYISYRLLGYQPIHFINTIIGHTRGIAREIQAQINTGCPVDSVVHYMYQHGHGLVAEDLAAELFWASWNQDYLECKDSDKLKETIIQEALSAGAW